MVNKQHVIIDFSYLYYKYMFQVDSGRMRSLSCNVKAESGEIVSKDISKIYYPIKEVESIRKSYSTSDEDCTVSVCFDMPSDRKGDDAEYKANRVHRLGEEDIANIREIHDLLETAGYNVFRVDGTEADDIVAYLAMKYADQFEQNTIYTPDADLVNYVRSNVDVMRFKAAKGYTRVTVDNFSAVMGPEMKCQMPYGAMTLFKATVGDKSDCIPGIRGFGSKAFDKLVDFLNSKGVNWRACTDFSCSKEALEACKEYLGDDKFEQAMKSFRLVEPRTDKCKDIGLPSSVSTREKREKAYSKYGMVSLI